MMQFFKQISQMHWGVGEIAVVAFFALLLFLFVATICSSIKDSRSYRELAENRRRVLEGIEKSKRQREAERPMRLRKQMEFLEWLAQQPDEIRIGNREAVMDECRKHSTEQVKLKVQREADEARKRKQSQEDAGIERQLAVMDRWQLTL